MPIFLASKRIVALDLSLIVAGTKYRGQFEERLKGILKELKESQDAHRLHRRDPLPDRRRLGRGLARRRQHPQAGAVARRDLLHRRHHAQGVPQVHREGPLAAAPLPVDPGRCRRRRSRRWRSSRASRDRYESFHKVRYSDEALRTRDLPVEPLHHRPPPARQGHRRHRRGRGQGQAAPRARHAEPAPPRAGDPAGGQGDEGRDLRQGVRAARSTCASARSSCARTSSACASAPTRTRELEVTRRDIEEVISSWTGIPVSSLAERGGRRG